MRQTVLLLLCFVFSAAVRAQVPVSEEPRHHRALINEWVRVLDVHIPPHDTTLFHKHSTPSVFIVLSNTRTGSQLLVEPGKAAFTAGNIWFESFAAKPRIHRVWNEDTVEFHVMDIELPHVAAGGAMAKLPGEEADGKLLFDAPSVRVFRLTLAGGQHQVLPRSQSPVLIINLSDSAKGVVNDKRFTQKGDFLFVPADAAIAVGNEGAGAEEFAVLYLK